MGWTSWRAPLQYESQVPRHRFLSGTNHYKPGGLVLAKSGNPEENGFSGAPAVLPFGLSCHITGVALPQPSTYQVPTWTLNPDTREGLYIGSRASVKNQTN